MHLRPVFAVAVPLVLASASLVRQASAQEPAPSPQPEPPLQPLASPAPEPSPQPAPPVGNSGYRNGSFFIHTPDDVFRLYV